MRFTEELRQQSDIIFEGIFRHPFVVGIAKGEIPKKALVHYVQADYEYLNAFSRIYGIAVSHCETREEMRFFQKQLEFVLNGEVHPHENFCRVAGVNYSELQSHPLPPTAHHYIAHLTTAAQSGKQGITIAALLPCPWTYLEIGLRIVGKFKPTQDHPFYDWIHFYADLRVAESTNHLRGLLDDWADTASESDKRKAKEAFMKSMQLEYMFWEMSYIQERWPFSINKQEMWL